MKSFKETYITESEQINEGAVLSTFAKIGGMILCSIIPIAVSAGARFTKAKLAQWSQKFLDDPKHTQFKQFFDDYLKNPNSIEKESPLCAKYLNDLMEGKWDNISEMDSSQIKQELIKVFRSNASKISIKDIFDYMDK